MAKMRVVNTRFWIDDYISNLDPIEKLLFLYFLTNPMTDICGVYEIPLKVVAVETGIDKEMVIKILKRFEKEDKMFYENGWVAIKNFKKHQSLNPKVVIGMEIGLTKAPKELIDRLSKPMDSLSHSNSNLNSNSNPNEGGDSLSATQDINSIINLFKEVNPNYERLFKNTTQRGAIERMLSKFGEQKLSGAIKALAEIITKPYAPRITTPVELENKFGQLIAFYKQNKKTQRIIL